MDFSIRALSFPSFDSFAPQSWPVQVLAYAAALVLTALALRGGARTGRWISGGLALFWAGLGGLVLVDPSLSEPASVLVAFLLFAQALIFLWKGVVRGSLDFGLGAGPEPQATFQGLQTVRQVAAAALFLHALVVSPFLSGLLGGWAEPSLGPGLLFAVVPLSIGILLLLRESDRSDLRSVAVLPFLIAILGGAEALDGREEIHLGSVLALVSVPLLFAPRRQRLQEADGITWPETVHDYAYEHRRSLERALVALLAAMAVAAFASMVAGDQGAGFFLRVGLSLTLLLILALAVWVSLPAWFSMGFRQVAYAAARGVGALTPPLRWFGHHWATLAVLVGIVLVVTFYILGEPGEAEPFAVTGTALLVAGIGKGVASARRRVVILPFRDYTEGEAGPSHLGKAAASRLRTELIGISKLYQTIDAAVPDANRMSQSPVPMVSQVADDFQGVLGPDASIQIGKWNLPVEFFFRWIGQILRGPQLTGSFQQCQSRYLFVATLSGGRRGGSWTATSDELSDQELRQGREEIVYTLAERLAYRIVTQLQDIGTPRWEAVFHFTKGLRIYRSTRLSSKDSSVDLRRAEREFVRALSKDRSFAPGYYNLGVIYKELGEPSSARVAFRKALKHTPGATEAYYGLAQVHHERGNQQLAAVFSARAIETRPAYARAWNLHGAARYYQWDTQKKAQEAQGKCGASGGEPKGFREERSSGTSRSPPLFPGASIVRSFQGARPESGPKQNPMPPCARATWESSWLRKRRA